MTTFDMIRHGPGAKLVYVTKMRGFVYLEPGELDALSKAALELARSEPAPHPRVLLLLALARELADLTSEPHGCILSAASADQAWIAASRYLRSTPRSDDQTQCADG